MREPRPLAVIPSDPLDKASGLQAVSTGLHMGDDGIFYGSGTRNLSYPQDGNELCFTAEEESFWFKHRNACVIAAVRRHPPVDKGCIFDIGGGNGYVSKGLLDAGFEVALLEPGERGASNAKLRGVPDVACATMDDAQFKPGSLPAVGLFDVIEHIEDDQGFLISIRKSMKRDAMLYLTVPAYSLLWSSEDIEAGHHRRYTLAGIRALLASAGFSVEFASYIFRFLPLPIFLFRSLPHRLGLPPRSNTASDRFADHRMGSGVLGRALDLLLKREVEHLVNNRPMRFGGSCLVVATVAATVTSAP